MPSVSGDLAFGSLIVQSVLSHSMLERGVHEGVILAKACPGTTRHEGEIHKAPVHIGCAALNAQIITHRRGDIDAGPLVGLVFGARIAEHILPVVCNEGAAVLPLGKAVTPIVIYLYPGTPAYGFVLPILVAAVPGDHLWRLGLGTSLLDVVVGQRHIEGIELRRERQGRIGAGTTVGGVRVVKTSIVVVPSAVPAAGGVGGGVVPGGAFAYIEIGGSDVEMPGEGPGALGRGGQFGIREVFAVALVDAGLEWPGFDGCGLSPLTAQPAQFFPCAGGGTAAFAAQGDGLFCTVGRCPIPLRLRCR